MDQRKITLQHQKKNEKSDNEIIPLEEDLLKALYRQEDEHLTEEESLVLTPILNSLTDASDRYQEIEPIAQGGEKRITQVYDASLGRSVAMARPLHGETNLDQEDFLREARLTAGLEHPNIVTVHNIGNDVNGEPFFTMELLPGDNLKDIIDRLRADNADYRKKFSLTTRLNIFEKICDAIAYAHSRRVLHLDLKPENIRIGPFGEVFVCDWGLAKVMKTQPSEATVDTLDGDLLNDINLSGTIRGTPGFMAPEQGSPGATASEAMDIYALGSLLYMLLTFELPVEGDSANEVLKNSQTGKIIPPHRRKSGLPVPKSLAAVTLKALARKPDLRYADTVELRDEIQRYLTGFTTSAEKADLFTRAGFMIRRHSRGALAAMLFMMIIVAVVFFSMLHIRNERDVAKEERIHAEENLALYIAEQQRSKLLGTELGEVVQQAGNAVDLIRARSMIDVLDKGLRDETDPKHKNNLLINKALLLFTLQEFNAAQACFSEARLDQKYEALEKISADYSQIKTNDTDLLSEKELAELLIQIRSKYLRFATDQAPILQYMYFHHIKRHPNPTHEEYLPLATVMLDQLNDQRRSTINNPLKLAKRADGYYLDLRGRTYTQYRLNIMGGGLMNILRPFGPIQTLDISHTPVTRINQLGGLRNVKHIRMVGLNLMHPNVVPARLGGIRELRKVTIDLGRYPEATQKKLLDQFIVETE